MDGLTARPRVLHVAQPVEAGVPTVVRDIVAHQLARGWRVAVACPPTGSLATWVAALGAELLPWPATRAPGPGLFREWRTLRRHVRRFAPDLVHLHSSKAGLVGRLVVRGRRPTVYQPHAWSFLAVRGAMRVLTLQWERLAARWTTVFLCVSEGETATGRTAGLRGRWSVCENGVDVTRFTPVDDTTRTELRAELGLDNRVVAVCVGRLCEQKGQDVLVAAWTAIAPEHAVLVLVGDGPGRSALENAAPPSVVFAGEVTDTAPWYQVADLAVSPSRWEGASLATREAMACGLSQVVSDVDGARDAVGDAGTVVAVDDEDALAQAIRERLADAALRAAESARARQIAVDRFDLDIALRKIDVVYDRMLIDS